MPQQEPIPIANPADATDQYRDTQRLFYFTFGAYGDDEVLVWGGSMERALDEAVEWLQATQPNSSTLVSDDELQELYREVKQELGGGASENEIQELATVDLTWANDRYIDYNWTVDDVVDGTVIQDALTRSDANRYAAVQISRSSRTISRSGFEMAQEALQLLQDIKSDQMLRGYDETTQVARDSVNQLEYLIELLEDQNLR